MNFKLGFGPMSSEIITAISFYTEFEKTPLMIIASRNQVDHDSGYVMNTSALSQQVSSCSPDLLWLCRDHCGPYFLDAEKQLSERDAIDATKKTIAMDIEQGFNLIHIDTSRVSDGYKTAEELIKFCLDLNPNINFEFGTEENVGVAAGIEKYKNDVAFAKQFPNMQFVVAQTGSLVREDYQAGELNFDAVKTLVGYANEAGVKLKEHNADYLTKPEIQLRKALGVHALNIAPQLGVIQTRGVRRAAQRLFVEDEWNNFANAVYKSKKWEKWLVDGDEDTAVDIAGHYLYQSDEYKRLTDALTEEDLYWSVEFRKDLFTLIDLYVKNI